MGVTRGWRAPLIAVGAATLALAAVIAIFLGELTQNFGLRPVMLWLVTIPYAINAVFWFAFYKTYPRDQERMKQASAAGQAPAS